MINTFEVNKNCDFCQEFYTGETSYFREIYQNCLSSRIIAERNGIIVIPTLGQLIPKSLLILPLCHYERIADLPEKMLETVCDTVKEFEIKLSSEGFPVVFEHGAKSKTGNGCGIYHAHLHLVPFPKPVSYSYFLPKNSLREANLKDALNTLRDKSETYLLFKDTQNRVAFINTLDYPHKFYQSQYFRKAIVNYLKVSKSWDWRNYAYVEDDVINTINFFG